MARFGRRLGEVLAGFDGVDHAHVGVPRTRPAGVGSSMIAVICFTDAQAKLACERQPSYQRWTGPELERRSVGVRVWEFPVLEV